MSARLPGRVLLGAVLVGLTAGLPAMGDGGQPAVWSRLALGARGAALGQAMSAVADDPMAAIGNPALLATLRRASLASQGALLPDGRQLDYAGLARLAEANGDWGWALGMAYYNDGTPYEQRSGDTAVPDGTFTHSASMVHAGLGGWLWERQVALGGSFKLYSEDLGDATANGMGFDLGLYWRARPWMDVGLSAQDLYGRVGWSTAINESLPLRSHLAVAFRLLQDRLMVASELVEEGDQGLHASSGVEWWAAPGHMAFRAGVQDGQPGLGFGAQGDGWGLHAALDYAVSLEQGALDQMQHRLSLTLGVDL